MKNLKNIKSWAEEDRPREKMLSKGPAALSDAEILAILIGSGTTELSAFDIGKIILHSVNQNLDELASLSFKAITKFKGIGPAKAVVLMAALELSRRKNESKKVQKYTITSSKDIYTYLRPFMLDLVHEEFWLILLNQKNEVIRSQKISHGGIDATIVDPRIIFKIALEYGCTAMVIAHNHPSGNLAVSEDDKKITQKLETAAQVLNLRLLDHLIFTNHGYLSFADEGLL